MLAMRLLALAGCVSTVLLGGAAACAESAEPQVFAPGVISGGAHDSAPAFSPDGREVYFGRSTSGSSFLMVSHRTPTGWSRPVVAPFSGRWLDMEPAMAPDGTSLVFVSNRPAFAGGRPIDGNINGRAQPGRGGNLWMVSRTRGGWGRPRRLPDAINDGGSIYAPSLAADGTLYFMKPAATGRFRLFRAERLGEAWAKPQPLPFSDGSTSDVDPAISPDQSFLIFGSARRAGTDIDLFLVRRDGAGWGPPVYLGEPLNGRTSDAEPRLGPDGRTLYFSSERLARAHVRASARAARIDRWDNGLYNIWRADLAPLLATVAVNVRPPSKPRDTADEQGVRAAEQRWSEAFARGDRATLEALLDADYVSVGARGNARTRADVIAAAIDYAAAHPKAAADALAPSVRIRVMGETAIVRHTGAADVSVDVLRHDGESWVAVYSQHTPIVQVP
jgi:hypothetical protein